MVEFRVAVCGFPPLIDRHSIGVLYRISGALVLRLSATLLNRNPFRVNVFDHDDDHHSMIGQDIYISRDQRVGLRRGPISPEPILIKLALKPH